MSKNRASKINNEQLTPTEDRKAPSVTQNTGEDRVAQLEEEIQHTRQEMEERIEELKYRLQPKRMIKEKFVGKSGKKLSDIRSSVSESASKYGQKAKEQVRRGREGVTHRVEEHPFASCGIALGAGLIVGLMLPVTSLEEEKLGPRMKKAKDRIDEEAASAIEKGREKMQGKEDEFPVAREESFPEETESPETLPPRAI